MKRRVGIPRALLYYKYYPLWKAFVEGLGMEVVVSPPTNRKILYQGVTSCVDEACFPVKIFCGHLLELKDSVDYLFIPRVSSVEKNGFLCAKFWGLPDIARNLLEGSYQILSPDIDLNRKSLARALFNFGLTLTRNPFRVLRSIRLAEDRQEQFDNMLQNGNLNLLEAIRLMEGLRSNKKRKSTGDLSIALLSHPYNIYDGFVSMDILKRLEEMDVDIHTQEMVPPGILHEEARQFSNIYWTYDRELAAAASYYIKRGVHGIIFVIAFPCGPDSLIMDYVTRNISTRIPILNLVFDEHQAEAGIVTRLESFVDIVRRKKPSSAAGV
jgi:predicted nucleotide-binding protein (sugar kinase/HSP70/actin superfamily)